jgi:hypothetical protein
VRSTRREIWEILKIWWFIVPGGALGVVAIIAAIHGTHHKTVWFWGFWAMTALLLAMGWRLRSVLKERDVARAELADEHSAEAGARRLDELADEAIIIREDEVPTDKWGTAHTRAISVFGHWQARADAEVRRSANAYMGIWRENPENPMLLHFGTPDQAREFVDFNVAQLRHIASELRK